MDNILYICDLVGVDHVRIGFDFNGTPPIRGVATARNFPAFGLAYQRLICQIVTLRK